jgi:hypothetical protein
VVERIIGQAEVETSAMLVTSPSLIRHPLVADRTGQCRAPGSRMVANHLRIACAASP